MTKLKTVIKAARVNQWIKNMSLFAAPIFAGKIFDLDYFLITIAGFLVFCSLSSASYIFNDLIDLQLDQDHPQKKKRPLAAGLLTKGQAIELVFLFSFFGLIGAISLSTGFFLIAFVFILLHFLYSLSFKKFALLDILSIASSFLIRVFAGEILTSLHIPIWLTFSVIFLSLFIASCKRRAELMYDSSKTRPALEHYRKQLLDFYNSTFATGTIIAYAMFTFQAEPPHFSPLIREFLLFAFPEALGRKWLMATTLPLVIIGIMRYAQLIYERDPALGEQPEKIITTDKPLIFAIVGWGLSIILFMYLL